MPWPGRTSTAPGSRREAPSESPAATPVSAASTRRWAAARPATSSETDRRGAAVGVEEGSAHRGQVDVGAELGSGIAEQRAHRRAVGAGQAVGDQRLEARLGRPQAHGVRGAARPCAARSSGRLKRRSSVARGGWRRPSSTRSRSSSGWRASRPASAARRRWCSKTPRLLDPPCEPVGGMGPPARAVEALPGAGVVGCDRGRSTVLWRSQPARSASPPARRRCSSRAAGRAGRPPSAIAPEDPATSRRGGDAARHPAARGPAASACSGWPAAQPVREQVGARAEQLIAAVAVEHRRDPLGGRRAHQRQRPEIAPARAAASARPASCSSALASSPPGANLGGRYPAAPGPASARRSARTRPPSGCSGKVAEQAWTALRAQLGARARDRGGVQAAAHQHPGAAVAVDSARATEPLERAAHLAARARVDGPSSGSLKRGLPVAAPRARRGGRAAASPPGSQAANPRVERLRSPGRLLTAIQCATPAPSGAGRRGQQRQQVADLAGEAQRRPPASCRNNGRTPSWSRASRPSPRSRSQSSSDEVATQARGQPPSPAPVAGREQLPRAVRRPAPILRARRAARRRCRGSRRAGRAGPSPAAVARCRRGAGGPSAIRRGARRQGAARKAAMPRRDRRVEAAGEPAAQRGRAESAARSRRRARATSTSGPTRDALDPAAAAASAQTSSSRAQPRGRGEHEVEGGREQQLERRRQRLEAGLRRAVWTTVEEEQRRSGAGVGGRQPHPGDLLAAVGREHRPPRAAPRSRAGAPPRRGRSRRAGAPGWPTSASPRALEREHVVGEEARARARQSASASEVLPEPEGPTSATASPVDGDGARVQDLEALEDRGERQDLGDQQPLPGRLSVLARRAPRSAATVGGEHAGAVARPARSGSRPRGRSIWKLTVPSGSTLVADRLRPRRPAEAVLRRPRPASVEPAPGRRAPCAPSRKGRAASRPTSSPKTVVRTRRA